MSGKDFFYNKAKQEGYRSRSAYKLIQLDEEEGLLAAGDTVVDLGAAPGGWLQVAAAAVGARGRVLGIDLQPIDPLEDVQADVETIQGDLTSDESVERLAARLPEAGADVVVSDMAPEMTGEYSLDQARSVFLAEQAADVALELLAPGGHCVIKVFQGRDVDRLRERLDDHFEHVRTTSPDASRDASSEIYLIGKRRIDPPVAAGDRMDLEIVDTGSEGDGLGRVEGYTIFVPDTTVGERYEVEIEEIKARYGFARKLS